MMALERVCASGDGALVGVGLLGVGVGGGWRQTAIAAGG